MINTTSKAMVKQALQDKRYRCTGFDEQNPNLEIDLGDDAAHRPWKLLLSPSAQELVEDDKTSKSGFINIFMEFPFLCKKEAAADVSRLLLLLNKGLPFPAFGFSEVEHIIYYRHMLYCNNGMIPIPIVTALVGLVALYVDSLAPSIELVASGTKSFVEVLEEMLAPAPGAKGI